MVASLSSELARCVLMLHFVVVFWKVW